MSLADELTEANRQAGGVKGGHARAEVICPKCHNDLEGATACNFCRVDPSAPDFENGEEAAREFLYRCGVER